MSKRLQDKQTDLNMFVLHSRGLKIAKALPNSITNSEYLKNMILACHDEILEVEEDIENVEEYIDVLHFVLTLANLFGVDLPDEYSKYTSKPKTLVNALRENLLIITRKSKCFKHWSTKTPTDDDMLEIKARILDMVNIIHTLCELKKANMVAEYDKKYLINIQRQREGY